MVLQILLCISENTSDLFASFSDSSFSFDVIFCETIILFFSDDHSLKDISPLFLREPLFSSSCYLSQSITVL